MPRLELAGYERISPLIHKVPSEARGALSFFDMYARGVVLQRERIEAGRERGPGEGLLCAFLDAHFFWTSVDKVGLLLDLLRLKDGDPALKQAWRAWKPKLDPGGTVRNLVEHIDGELKKGTMELANFTGQGSLLYRFDGIEYDVDAATAAVVGAHAGVVKILEERPAVP